MTADRKVQPGQPLQIPASVYNDLMDVRSVGIQRGRLGTGDVTQKLGSLGGVVVKARNNSTDRRAGDVLQLNDSDLTTLDKNNLLFEGVEPGSSSRLTWQNTQGILLQDTPGGDYGPLQIAGPVLAYVSVLDAGHYRCGSPTPAGTSNFILVSQFVGPWEILYKPAGTGEQLCVVVMGTKKTSSCVARLNGSLTGGTPASPESVNATARRRNKSTDALEDSNQALLEIWNHTNLTGSSGDHVLVSQDDDGDWWVYSNYDRFTP